MSHNTARQRQELRYPGAPVLDFIYEDEEPNYFIAGILASEPVPDTLRILFRKTFRGYRTTDDREPFERTVEYIASMAKGRVMPTTEPTINDALAEVLRGKRRAWQQPNVVRSENTGMLRGSHERPDILVIESSVSPVVIETEVLPAPTVEQEATSRLGKQIQATGKAILSSIAVRLPQRLRTKQGSSLRSELEDAIDLEMALYTGSDPSSNSRWPHSGWISGRVSDLSILVQYASVPPEVIDKAADQLVTGVSEVAGLLKEMLEGHPGAIHKIGEELRQEDSDQTRGMAATILANAFVFQENLAGGPDELASVNSLEQLLGSNSGLTKSAVLAEWRKILEVNYWPIFDIARRILEVIPTAESQLLIEGLAGTADKLLQAQLMRSHDLTGVVFQRLIADRKFLAAYYTTPGAAALLVGLAITPDTLPEGRSWSSAADVKELRIADFACGTGTLLSTAYQRISQLHELEGGDAKALHPDMMATTLVGCDVLPAATHLTASMLAGAHPSVKYKQSSILTVAYGKQPDGRVALGSLDLLNPQSEFEILSITATTLEGMGEVEQETWRSLPDASFDVAIMNPPFTRATGHEAEKIGVPNPMFAAFSSSDEEQRLMGDVTKRLTKDTSAHGNAGEASIFLVLADRKLKSDGVLALVMPLSLISGDAWAKSRALLAEHYSNLVIISIVGATGTDVAFSADTSIGECLIIGRKSKTGSTRATFIILNKRPEFPLLGVIAAEQIRREIESKNLRRLEDGPVNGTFLRVGDEVIGQALDAPLPVPGGWNVSRITDLSLAQTAYQLANKKSIWLPTMTNSEIVEKPITTVANIGKIGPYHADINYNTLAGGIRGPFDIFPIEPNSVPTYPVLWAHNAARERTMSFGGDREGVPRQGATPEEQAIVDRKVEDVWNTASHCHFNHSFGFNYQSTGMQFTPRKTIGGRAWLSISLASVDQEKALVVWANTSLGLLLHWWHSNKQQPGRGIVGKNMLHTLPILDVTALEPRLLAEAVKLFDSMSEQRLLPLHELDTDPVRKELDEAFARNVLRLPESILASGGPLELLRAKLSQEPSIRGSK